MTWQHDVAMTWQVVLHANVGRECAAPVNARVDGATQTVATPCVRMRGLTTVPAAPRVPASLTHARQLWLPLGEQPGLFTADATSELATRAHTSPDPPTQRMRTHPTT